jgi:hypothetical protein
LTRETFRYTFMSAIHIEDVASVILRAYLFFPASYCLSHGSSVWCPGALDCQPEMEMTGVWIPKVAILIGDTAKKAVSHRATLRHDFELDAPMVRL